MPSQLDALQTPIPVDFRRLAGGFHSVTKQASFDIALGSDVKGFWTSFCNFLVGLGNQNESQNIFFERFLFLCFP